MFYKFNLNHNIKVKLHEKGLKRLVLNNFKDYPVNIDYYRKRIDKDGYMQFQMWEFMSEFGEHILMGMQEYFETEVLIELVI